jgi:hypothetical protein
MWYAKNTSSDQGLIIDEATGRNVAVAYDKADAPLLAAAPEMLAVCKALAERSAVIATTGLGRQLDDAIKLAEGGAV